ncbi:MAG TPA: LysR substrate-binding domain-containing protein [Sphingobium sp.]|uniref:LysR substrate-binding domain-containing protein n=1 Tax=Sphingobium sp. TaxID=1912891 RepID=UPI002ED4FC60
MAPLPPLAAIRAFEAAARHENFSRAAEELALTQAGVSYQIKLLEERLGAQLFQRKGRGMVLTDLGRRIAPRVTEAFTTLNDAFSMARAENEGVLGITASQTFATNWLAGRLGSFHIRHPDLAVRLDVSNVIVDLNASEFDIAIRGTATPTPGMTCHFLFRQIITPMASPAFLADHRIETAADLLNAPRLSPTDEWWDVWFGSLPGFEWEQRREGVGGKGIRFDSQVLDGHAAIAGHGVAILSPAMFVPAIAAGQLVQLFPDLACEPRHFFLVYPEHKRNQPKIRAFRDWLMAAIKDAVGDDPYGVLVPPETPANTPG